MNNVKTSESHQVGQDPKLGCGQKSNKTYILSLSFPLQGLSALAVNLLREQIQYSSASD